MRLREILRELWWALADALAYGDLPGHLAAWWEVATGRVRADDRVAVEVSYG